MVRRTYAWVVAGASCVLLCAAVRVFKHLLSMFTVTGTVNISYWDYGICRGVNGRISSGSRQKALISCFTQVFVVADADIGASEMCMFSVCHTKIYSA